MKYLVQYYYLASGMEGRADQRDIGEFEAPSSALAIEEAIYKELGGKSYEGWTMQDSISWLRSCLSAKLIPEPKAVLSKRERVEPTKEAWAAEIKYRANYTGTSELGHAIDEIVRLHETLLKMQDEINKRMGAL